MVSTSDEDHLPQARLDSSKRLSANEIQALRAENAQLKNQIACLTQELAQKEVGYKTAKTHLGSILDNAYASIVSYRLYADEHWEYDYYSAGCEQVFGYTAAEMMQGVWLSCIPTEDRQAVIAPCLQALLAERSYTIEYRFRHKSGEMRWVSSTQISQRDENYDCWRVVAVDTDITDRKRIEAEHQQAEAALSQREQEFRALVENSPDMISRVDRQFRYRYANPQQERETGVPCADWIGKTEFDLGYPPEVVQPWHDLVTLVFKTGESQHLEADFPCVGGMKHWSCRLVPEFAADGSVASVLTIARDITERKRMELALRDAEARNRAILETIPDLLIRVRRNGECFEHFISNTSRPNKLFIPKKHISEVLPPDALENELAAIERALDTQTLQTYELTFIKQGQMAFEEVRVVPLGEGLDEVLLMVRDISDRKRSEYARDQAENALQQQLKKEQSLNQLIHAIHQSLDLEVIFSTAVQEVAQVLGVDQVSILRFLPEQGIWQLQMRSLHNSPMMGLEFPDDDSVWLTQLKQFKIIQISDTAIIDADHPMIRMLASHYPGACLMVPLAIGGRVWGALILIHRGYAYRWQEEALTLVQAVVDQVAIAISKSELYHHVTQFNAVLERQVQERTTKLQQALEFESILKHIADKVRDSLDETHILQTAVTELGKALAVECCDAGLYNAECTATTISYEYAPSMSSALGATFAMSDAEHFYTHLLRGEYIQACELAFIAGREVHRRHTMLACPIFDDQGTIGDLWLFKPNEDYFDESAIRLVQQVANHCAIALRQSRLYSAIQSHATELESLNRLKDEFLSTVSHELRTPIANMKMAIQMLEVLGAPAATPSERAVRYFQILKDECNRESSLINDLLDLSRLESGLVELNQTPIRLQHWIPHIAEAFEERTRTQQQQLHYRLAADLPPLMTDVSYLQRIVTELLHNACKYTPPQEQIIIAVECEPAPQPTLVIYITNTGVEISEAERDRVFDKFYRISHNDPWKHGGTGLGLALVKRLVSCLGGTIALESGANQTTFVLRFPL